MAARLPINKLPFETDTELHDFDLGVDINGEPIVERLTKRQYFDKIMTEWYTKSTAFAAAKAAESEARAKLVALMYPNSFDEEGTDKFELPSGWVLELKRRINVKVDEEVLPSVRKAVAELPVDEETGEMASLESAIRMKPDFSMSGYRNLREDVKTLVMDCVTFTPGTPGVELVPPKQKAAQRASDQKAQAKAEK